MAPRAWRDSLASVTDRGAPRRYWRPSQYPWPAPTESVAEQAFDRFCAVGLEQCQVGNVFGLEFLPGAVVEAQQVAIECPESAAPLPILVMRLLQTTVLANNGADRGDG